MTYPVEIEVQVESPQVVIQPAGAPVIIFAATAGVQGVQGPPGPVDVYEFANLAAFPGTGVVAKVYVADDTNKAYRWNGSTYIEVSPSIVTSVNGQTAVVVLAKGDVGLGNVDNTPDLKKPVSAAQAAADTRKALDLGGDNRDNLFKVGIYTFNEMADYLPTQTEALGISYARIGGVLNDAEITYASKHNIEVLWTAKPASQRPTYASDALYVAAMLSTIDTALNAYGPRGTFWTANPTLRYNPIAQVEVDNEPNFYYGTGTNASWAAIYIQVLTAAYDHIKVNWPEVTVVAGSAGAASAASPGFISALLDALQTAGRLDCFDVLSTHMYPDKAKAPEQLITETWGTWYADHDVYNIRKNMLQKGIDRPLWITEGGYSIDQANGGHYNISGAYIVTPTQHAAYSIRLNMAAARYGVQRFYHMSIRDTDNFNSGWFTYQSDGSATARPVATANRQLIKLLQGATHLEVLLDGSAGDPATSPFAYRFTTPRGRVTVAWCQTPGTYSLPIDPDTPTTVTDMLGNAVASVTASSYSAALSETPIFVYSNAYPGSTDVIPEGSTNLYYTDARAQAANVTALTGKQSVLVATAVKTSAYTAAVSDLIPADTTSAGFTITLPATPPDRARVVIKKMDATSNAVTVAAAGSDKFNTSTGPTSFGLSLQNQAVQLQYSAAPAIWYVISTDIPLTGLDARYQQAGAFTTKGDILAATGAAAPVRVGVGADNTVLTANSASPNGLSWTSVSFSSAVDNLDGTITYSGSATDNGDGTITIN